LSETSPTLPSGFTKKRLLGFIVTDSSSNLLNFKVYGNGKYKEFTFDEFQNALSTTNPSTTWTTLSLASFVPNNRQAIVTLHMNATPSTVSNITGRLRIKGSSSTTGQLQVNIISPDITTGDDSVIGFIGVDSSSEIEYSVDVTSDPVTNFLVDVLGFKVEL